MQPKQQNGFQRTHFNSCVCWKTKKVKAKSYILFNKNVRDILAIDCPSFCTRFHYTGLSKKLKKTTNNKNFPQKKKKHFNICIIAILICFFSFLLCFYILFMVVILQSLNEWNIWVNHPFLRPPLSLSLKQNISKLTCIIYVCMYVENVIVVVVHICSSTYFLKAK